jgi:uncharacterized Zn finger protein
MSDQTFVAPDRPLSTLTVGDLETIITEIVRKVIREEIQTDYYVNEDGIKVRYYAEDIAPDYLAELQQQDELIATGQSATVDGGTVLVQMRNLGLDI